MCEHCKTFAEENNLLAEQISSLQAETLQLVYQKRALKRELDAKKKASPTAKDVDRLLRLWRATCVPKRGQGRVTIDIESDRGDVVRSALRNNTKGTRRERWLTCRHAILGMSLRPYVVEGKRRGAGPKEARYADIHHALGKARQIEEHSQFYLAIAAKARDVDWAITAWDRARDVADQWRAHTFAQHMLVRKAAELDSVPYEPPVDVDSLGHPVGELEPAVPEPVRPRLFVVPDPKEAAA